MAKVPQAHTVAHRDTICRHSTNCYKRTLREWNTFDFPSGNSGTPHLDLFVWVGGEAPNVLTATVNPAPGRHELTDTLADSCFGCHSSKAFPAVHSRNSEVLAECQLCHQAAASQSAE